MCVTETILLITADACAAPALGNYKYIVRGLEKKGAVAKLLLYEQGHRQNCVSNSCSVQIRRRTYVFVQFAEITWASLLVVELFLLLCNMAFTLVCMCSQWIEIARMSLMLR